MIETKQAVTIISGTNRLKSNTSTIVRFLDELLKGKVTVSVLDLVDFPVECISSAMYDSGGQHESIAELQDRLMIPAEKFIFVIPEYNGGFPGILKLFIDACSARAYQKTFGNKKALLLGVATGRSGNLRGIEHFSSILNYLGVIVYPEKLPVSRVHEIVNSAGEIKAEDTRRTLAQIVEKFLAF